MVVSISRMWLRAGIIAGMMMSLAGCQSFFPALTTTTPVTTTGGNFVYVANETTLTVAGYAVATSTAGVASLAAISGSPYALAQIPTAMAITPSDSFSVCGRGWGHLRLRDQCDVGRADGFELRGAAHPYVLWLGLDRCVSRRAVAVWVER